MFYGPECGLSWWMFHVSLRRMCILLLLGQVFCKCQLNPVDCWCCSVQLYPYWFSIWWNCQLLSIEISNYNYGFVDFSLEFSQFLPHVFWCSVVRYIHINDCYVFLENWPLYSYVIPLFIFDKIPCSEVCFVWN